MDGNNQTTDFWTHTHKLIKRVIKQKQSCAPNLHFIQVFAITFFFLIDMIEEIDLLYRLLAELMQYVSRRMSIKLEKGG